MFFFNSSVLYEKELMERIIEFVMEKLRATKKASDKKIQLLEILGTLCVCKGVAVDRNQSKECIITQSSCANEVSTH